MAAAVESIYNLIPKEHEPVSKPPRYVSQHAPMARQEYKAVMQDGRLMGPSNPSDKTPASFQRKHVGGAGATIKNPTQKRDHTITKPPVPSKQDKPVMGLKSDKNWVATNAADMAGKSAAQHKPKVQLIPGGRGGVVNPEDAGLQPKYTGKKTYGKVPSYLTRRQMEEAKAQEEYDAYLKQVEKEGAHYEVTAEEREGLLKGLKENMAGVQREYQGLSMVADTTCKKAHKKRLEEQLAALEADIAKIERHPVILVAK